MNTITLSGIRSKQSIPEIHKQPQKKNDQIELTVYLDGEEYSMSFRVPISAQLMSGQKNKLAMGLLLKQVLEHRFGRAEML